MQGTKEKIKRKKGQETKGIEKEKGMGMKGKEQVMWEGVFQFVLKSWYSI